LCISSAKEVFASYRLAMSITFKLVTVFSSLFIASSLVFLEAPVAMACSPDASSASGVSHGSSLYSGSVTVCLGIQATNPVPQNPATAPKPGSGISIKPVPKPAPCPTAAQKKQMPRSADAAERWLLSICGTPAKPVAKPATPTKPAPVALTPVATTYNSAAVSFSPNPLLATVYPGTQFTAGDSLSFSSNPSLHFGSQVILGRQAEVQFSPAWLGWQFSDGPRVQGVDVSRIFDSAGKYQAWAIANYFVSYRIIGESAWVAVPGQISVLSNVIDLDATQRIPQVTPSPKKPLLVGGICNQSASNWGCIP
jgi:hypothetical protein